jgi:CBS domain-containing protein
MTKIADIMTRDVQVVRPDDTVQRAAQCMKDLDVGAVPVCDGRKLLGMITDRDITVRASAAGLSPAHTRVLDVMTKDLRWCREDESATEVLDGMGEHQIRRLPVVNAQKELVGIVSLGDLATRQRTPVGETLRDISTPARVAR